MCFTNLKLTFKIVIQKNLCLLLFCLTFNSTSDGTDDNDQKTGTKREGGGSAKTAVKTLRVVVCLDDIFEDDTIG